MIELVWDAGQTATARLAHGQDLTVGEHPALSPIELAAVSVAASVMAAFMEAASEANATVLGYVATAEVEQAESSKPAMHLRSYVVGAEGMNDELFSALAVRALERSVVARLLGESVQAEWDLRVLHGV